MVAPETLTSWLYTAVQGHLWRHCPWVPRQCYSHIIVVSFCRLLLSALLVKHIRTVTRCRRPPAPELAAREFRSHDLSLARDCSLLPYCSPLLGIAAAHGSWHGGTIMLAHRLTCRRAVIGSIMRENQNFKELCCCPCGLTLVCRLELHQRPPRLCPALSCLSYGRNGAYTALVMRSTIWSMVTESLFIALMISTRARTLSCSCMYHL